MKVTYSCKASDSDSSEELHEEAQDYFWVGNWEDLSLTLRSRELEVEIFASEPCCFMKLTVWRLLSSFLK